MSVSSSANWSRRELLRSGSALLALAVTGCAPARIVLGAYPAPFKRDAELTDRVLRAFVDTVVPGLPRSEPHPVRVFSDDFFPFARFRGYFASDLCRRAGDLSGVDAFDRLTPAQRTRVVRAGSESGGVTGQLYTGAIVLVQAATYGGIYDAAGDVPFIDFQGFRYGASDPGACSYPDPRSFLAPTLARDGNPA